MQGHPSAQNNLGVMLKYGRGVSKNWVEAHAWYNLAASRHGDEEGAKKSRRNRDELEGSMTAQQITAAHQLAQTFLSGKQFEASTAEQPPADVIARVMEVQRHLARLGFNPGPVDGAVGPGTRRAVIAYQQSRALAADGAINEVLLERLRNERSPVAQPAAAPSGVVPTSGSAFYVSEAGHLLTNAHVVSGCQQLNVIMPGEMPASAKVIATDERDDLALLKASTKAPAVAMFRGGAAARVGEPVIVYGFPLTGALASSGNLVTGTLSALAGLGDNPRHYQISAPVQPGNSGGPLLDESARVIGVVVGKLNALRMARLTGDVPQNVNFAIKASAATAFLEAHGIQGKFAVDEVKRAPAEVADTARAHTVRVECRRKEN